MILYKLDPSPPARSAMMVAELVGTPVERVDVNAIEKEQYQPKYLKKNPLHTIPFFEDGDLVLHDSHAIIIYLVEKYGKDESLYPKNPKDRALINQKLFFDTAILFPRLRSITFAAAFEGVKTPTQKQLDDIEEAYGFMETFLTANTWLAGDHMTIADIAAIATISSIIYLLKLDTDKYPKLSAWMKKMEKQSFYEKCNAPGNAQFATLVGNLLSK